MDITENSRLIFSGSSSGHVKIFDAGTLRLLESLKADQKDISCLAIEHFEKYFAFVDEANTVYIYQVDGFERLKTIKFGDLGSVVAINFTTHNKTSYMFVCVKGYGVFYMTEKDFKKDSPGIDLITEIRPRKDYQAIEMHKDDDLILTIDQECTLCVWSMEDILNNNKRLSPLSKFKFKTVFQDFYLRYENNMILMMNKNSHAFYYCKDFKKLDLVKIQDFRYRKINYQMKERSQICSFNNLYTMIAVNVEKTGDQAGDEPDQFSCDIFIYADQLDKELLLKKHIVHDYMGLEFNTNIFAIRPNPRYDDIFLTGDSDGRIIVWDLASMHILSVFKEFCYHINLPRISNPILEIVFKQNGNEFYVSTFYGSISFYSSISQNELLLTEHDQQFMTTDFINDNTIVPKLCNAEMQEQKVCRNNDDKTVNQFKLGRIRKVNDKRDIINQQNELSTVEFKDFFKIQRREFETEHGFGKEEITKELNSYFFSKKITKIDKAEKRKDKISTDDNKLIDLDFVDQERSDGENSGNKQNENLNGRKRLFNSERLNKNFSNMKIEEKISESSEFSDYEEETPRPTRTLRRKTIKQIIVESSSESEEFIEIDQRTKSGNNSRPIRKSEKSSVIKENSKSIRQRSTYRNSNKEELTCSSCGGKEANYLCSVCNTNMDYSCSEKYFIKKTRNSKICYKCFFNERSLEFDKIIKKNPERPFLVECNRTYLNMTAQLERIEESPFVAFQPQIGEKYYFIPEAFLSFLRQYRKMLNADFLSESINTLLSIKKDLLVEIVDYEFYFPWVNYKYELRELIGKDYNDLFIMTNLTLKVSQKTNNVDLKEDSLFKCSFAFNNDIDSLFLIPEVVYLEAKNIIKRNQRDMVKVYHGRSYIIKNIMFNKGSLYNTIELSDLDSGVRSRNTIDEKDTEIVHAYTLVLNNKDTIFETQPRFNNKAFYDILNKNVKGRKLKKFEAFFYPVNKEEYDKYLSYVEVEMNLDMILKRAGNYFYFSKEQVIKDINLIRENAKKFNEEKSIIRVLARELEEELLLLLDRSAKTTPNGLRKRSNSKKMDREEEEPIYFNKRRKIK